MKTVLLHPPQRLKALWSAVIGPAVLLTALGMAAGGPVQAQTSSTVTVNAASTTATIPSTAFGIHTSVYDGNLDDAAVPGRLNSAGVSVMRYPGGGYADQYHWSTNTDTQFQNTGNLGFIASNTDFGHFINQVLAVTGGTPIITVNYGSDVQGNAGGTPQEAAAWVAYCNGSTTSTQSIGTDSAGNNWQTVGFWASLRAASPLGTDDGKNFLRIAHSASLGVKFWEVGNEVFGNGFYSSPGYENDWHVAYTGSSRVGLSTLSGTAYGTNVKAYVTAMKAVDSTIKIGVVATDQPEDSNMTDWNGDVLSACGTVIDFVAVHYYAGFYLAPNYTVKDPVDTLNKASNIQNFMNATQSDINTFCGTNAPNVKVYITETNANPLSDEWVNALFAGLVYAG